jgi:rubrerythrin
MILSKSLKPTTGYHFFKAYKQKKRYVWIFMKKENCPFCGHRWVRKANESPIVCPACKRKYYSPEQIAAHQKNKK